MTRALPILFTLVFTSAAACGAAVPMTRYYQLAPPTGTLPETAAGSVLAIEPLSSEGAYDDDRIVYRAAPVRLDYYQYHRWSTTPGSMLGGYLQQALARSGKFRSVVRDTTTDTAAVLGGRVLAIEEIDESPTRWIGHVAVELTLTDPKSGEILWSQAFDQREPLASRSPEGLARALGIAMDRIARAVTPEVAARAERQARLHGQASPPIGLR